MCTFANAKTGHEKPIIALRNEEDMVILKPEEIYMVRVENGNSIIYGKDSNYRSRKRLYELQTQLGNQFMQISKSTLINLSYIDGVEPGFSGALLLKLKNGLRDYVILLLLYTTGMRVSDLIQLRVKDISLTEPYTMRIHGKGNKGRYVPLMKTAIPHIQRYLSLMNYDCDTRYNEVLFKNHMGNPFTRQGINYVLKKYGYKARANGKALVPEDLSPHKIRHTTAMELLASGVDLIYIRDLLGHSSVTTTEIYARTDAQLKRKAIEAASKELVPEEDAVWDNDTDLKDWLRSFNKA